MTDKTTGEVYIKRPNDEKIISFRQRSHTVYEAIQEFNIQYQSSVGYTYPNHPGSYLLGIKVDVDEYLQDERKTNILTDNHVFSEAVTSYKDFWFGVASSTNGFFIKPITRLGDRNICGYLNGQFSKNEVNRFAAVSQTFEDWLENSKLYESAYLYTEWRNLEKWKSCNALIDCTITSEGRADSGKHVKNTISITTPIKLNEYSFVRFPDDYKADMDQVYSTNVVITKIYSPKLQYEAYLNKKGESSAMMSKLLEVDNIVVLKSVDVFYFINDSIQLPTNPNTIIDQCIDTEFLDDAIVSLSVTYGSKSVQSQVEEPEVWMTDTVWAEEIRDITNGNKVTETNSIHKFKDIERTLYHDPEETLEYTEHIIDRSNILVYDASYSIDWLNDK